MPRRRRKIKRYNRRAAVAHIPQGLKSMRAPLNLIQVLNGVTINYRVIFNELNSRCRHHIDHYELQGNEPINCQTVGNKLIEALNAGVNVDARFLTAYLHYVFKFTRGYSKTCCLNSNPNTLTLIIKDLLKYIVPSDTMIIKIMLHREEVVSSNPPILFNALDGLISNKNFTQYSSNVVLKVLKTEFMNCNYEHMCDNYGHKKILNHLLKNCTITSIIGEYMLNSGCELINKVCLELITNKKLIVNQDHLYTACKNLPTSKQLMDVLAKTPGLEIDSRCLEDVCSFGSLEAIRSVLEYKIHVTRTHFHKLILSNKSKNNKDAGYSKDKLNLLILAGYRLDIGDIEFSIIHKRTIPDIERFNIPLDDKIYMMCHQYKFYPKYKFTLSNMELVELQKLCYRKSGNVIKFIEKHKIKPDKLCMDHACTVKHNFKNITYLIGQGCEITNKNLINMNKSVASQSRYGYRRAPDSKILNNILDTGRKTYLKESLTHKNRIKDLYNRLQKYESVEEPSEINSIESIERELLRDYPEPESKIKKKLIDDKPEHLIPTPTPTPTTQLNISSKLDLDDIDIANIDIGDKIITFKPKLKIKDDENLLLDIDIEALLNIELTK